MAPQSTPARAGPTAAVITNLDQPSEANREVVQRAAERFLETGVQLPDLTISFPVICGGKAGAHSDTRPYDRRMAERSEWTRIIEEDPEHSQRYIQRFRDMAAKGVDLGGEARLIDAMVGRNARILDAGCGPGRVGAILFDCGHRVVGVDGDPALIAAAQEDHPGPTWVVGDLADLDLPAQGIDEPFDAIVCAGNVMAFLAASTRQVVLERLSAHLADDGRLVTGFGTGRGYEFDDFFDHVAAAGLEVDLRASTWDLRRQTDDSEFVVAVLMRKKTRPSTAV